MKLLIVGPNSYIAKHFTEHTVQTHPDWIIDKLSVREDHWKTYDYSGYDSVLYFAAVVQKKETPELDATSYVTDIALESRGFMVCYSVAAASSAASVASSVSAVTPSLQSVSFFFVASRVF